MSRSPSRWCGDRLSQRSHPVVLADQGTSFYGMAGLNVGARSDLYRPTLLVGLNRSPGARGSRAAVAHPDRRTQLIGDGPYN